MTWWTESTPDEIKPIPWMHPATVLYLESLLTPDMHVIEHGCGGSTLWFIQKVKSVASYESNPEWIKAVQKRSQNHNFTKDEDGYKYGTMLFPEYTTSPEVSKKADLLFIDGHGADRPEWIRAAHKIVKPGGVVVVDNSERNAYHEAMGALSAYCVKPLHIVGFTDYGKLVQTTFMRLRGGESWI